MKKIYVFLCLLFLCLPKYAFWGIATVNPNLKYTPWHINKNKSDIELFIEYDEKSTQTTFNVELKTYWNPTEKLKFDMWLWDQSCGKNFDYNKMYMKFMWTCTFDYSLLEVSKMETFKFDIYYW